MKKGPRQEETPLQRRLQRLGRALAYALRQTVKKLAVTAKPQALAKLHDKGSGHKVFVGNLLDANPARAVFNVLDNAYNNPVFFFRQLVCKKIIFVAHLHSCLPNPIICKTNNFSLILLYLPACQKANGSACITKNLLCAQQTNTNGMQSQTGGLLGPPVWLECGCTGKKTRRRAGFRPKAGAPFPAKPSAQAARPLRCRTRVVGSFPDGNSALMLVCARLRHVAGTQWGNKKYMNMKHLEAVVEGISIADPTHTRTCKPFCEKFLTLPPPRIPTRGPDSLNEMR